MANQLETVADYTVYSGLTTFQVLAVNPSSEQYEKLTGKKLKFPLEYKESEKGLVNLKFLLKEKNTGNFFLQGFNFGKLFRQNNAKDKTVFTNSKFQEAWLKDKNDKSMTWFDSEEVREKYMGETSLINLLKAMLGYKKEDGELNEVFAKAGIKFKEFLKFNFKSFNDLLAKQGSVTDTTLTYGQSGFAGLVTINDKGYMEVDFNGSYFFKPSIVLDKEGYLEDTNKVKYSSIEKNALFLANSVLNGYTTKTGKVVEGIAPKNAYQFEWGVYSASSIIKTEKPVTEEQSTTKDEPVVVEKEADDLPF